MNKEDIKNKFERDFEKAKCEIGHPNILLIGKTGVGKSTLINTIFGRKLADISHSKPQTRGFHKYFSQSLPVNIIDSEGYELGREQYFISQLKEYINARHANLKEQIHICWYAVSVSSNRILEFDLQVIQTLKDNGIPTAVVFTQCDLDDIDGSSAKAMSNIVYDRFGSSVPCFETSNDPELNKSLDIDKMIDWSAKNINNDNLRAGFIAAQCASLGLKEKEVDKTIYIYIGLAATTAASPIPVSDTIILTALQTKMAADIYSKYGIDNTASDLIQHVIKNNLIGILGKMAAGNLIKLIPVIGPWVGAGVNALVASSITYGLGQTISYMCREAIKSAWNGESYHPMSDEAFKKMADMFTSEYKNKHS